MYLIIAIVFLIFGLIIGVILGRFSAPKNEAEIQALKSAIQEKEVSFEKITDERIKSFEDRLNLEKEMHERELENLRQSNQLLVETLEKNNKDSLSALKEQFVESSNSMSQQLKNATEQMLKQRQQEFSETSGEKINSILQPLKASLQAMQEKVSENTTRHTELGGKLSESIKNLLDHTETAQASADRLARMLKGNTKHQGEWGERILKEILESLNLQEGIHFDVQNTIADEKGQSIKNEEGKMGRPDIILHLDQNKDVIIDSKVSLTSYLAYQEAQTEDERQQALRKHIMSIEKHVSELVKKDYSGYVTKPRVRLGYVIMFIPNTSALLLATKAKPTLWREAMEKNVYIADEQTLYAALKIVSLTWQQIAQNANHTKVFELAEEMIQRVTSFMKSFNEIGEQLSKATKSFEEGKKKLENGGQSIPKTCRKLIDLGAKTPKIPKGVDKSLFGVTEYEISEDDEKYVK